MRLSVTDLCNLRCRYCMPEEGVCKLRHEEILTEDEMILVQGIIDAFFIEEDENGNQYVVVADYKTDRVKESGELVLRYRTQLEYYAEALERMTRLPVRERIIYSFRLHEEIPL